VLLGFLGRHAIPAPDVRAPDGTLQARRLWIGIQKEHGRIYDAIRGGQRAQAHNAMRTHLALPQARRGALPPAPLGDTERARKGGFRWRVSC